MIAKAAPSLFLADVFPPVARFESPRDPAPLGTLFVLGATHRTAPLLLRERLALRSEAEAGLAAELSQIDGLREFVLLATCNRTEIYGVATHGSVADRAQQVLCSRQGISLGEFQDHRLHLEGIEAVRHLLAVASGLDSQMVGETEIFGQIKKAYAVAQERASAGPILNRAFQKVFQGAKHIRSSTAITVGQVSVANVAVELAANIFGDIAPARILLLGTGEIGEKTARAFQSRGARSVTLCGRRLERASTLSGELGMDSIPFEERERRLADFDIVVSSTSAPGAVLSAEAAGAAMRLRPDRPMFFIDLALPRDVDPAVSNLNNVFLYNLDDLAKIAERNRAARAAEIANCQVLLETRAAAIAAQLEAQLSGNRAAVA